MKRNLRLVRSQALGDRVSKRDHGPTFGPDKRKEDRGFEGVIIGEDIGDNFLRCERRKESAAYICHCLCVGVGKVEAKEPTRRSRLSCLPSARRRRKNPGSAVA